MTTPGMADKAPRIPGAGRTYTSPKTRKPYFSITSILDFLPKKELFYWAAKTVAEAAVYEQKEWRGEIRKIYGETLSPAQKVDLRRNQIQWLKKAPERFSQAAADRGTDAHLYFELKLAGRKISPVLEELVHDYIPVIDRWFQIWQPDPIEIEFTVVNDTERYAGTGDCICWLPGLGAVGIDVKTARSGVRPSMAMQQAAVANGEYIAKKLNTHKTWDKRFEIKPMPHVDRWAILRFRPICLDKKCKHRIKDPCTGLPNGLIEFVPVDGNLEGAYRQFLAARDIAEASVKEIHHYVLPAFNNPMRLPNGKPQSYSDEIKARILNVIESDNDEAIEDLVTSWPTTENGPVPTFKDLKGKRAHTFSELKAIEIALHFVERQYELPFAQTHVPNRMIPVSSNLERPIAPQMSYYAVGEDDGKAVDPEKVEKLRKKFRKLPADIVQSIEAELRRMGVRLDSLSNAHYKALKRLVKVGQTLYKERVNHALFAATDVDEPTQARLAMLIFDTHLDWEKKSFARKLKKLLSDGTELELTLWAACCYACGPLDVGPTGNRDIERLKTLKRYKLLEHHYGSKTMINVAAKEIAEEFNLGKPPRSANEVASVFELSALLLYKSPAFNPPDTMTPEQAEKWAKAQLAKIQAKEDAEKAAEYEEEMNNQEEE